MLPDGRSAVKCFTELSTRLNEFFHDKLSNMVGFLHTFDGLVELRRINVCSSCHFDWINFGCHWFRQRLVVDTRPLLELMLTL